MHTTNCQQHFIQCVSHWYHLHGSQYHHKKNKQKPHNTPWKMYYYSWLFHQSSQCNHLVLYLQYNLKHSPNCITFIRRECKKYVFWPFLPGQSSFTLPTNTTEWINFLPLYVFLKICNRISCRSRIKCIILMLHRRMHPAPCPSNHTPMHCNNSTTARIANNIMKWQCSHSMEMWYFWESDLVDQKDFNICWHFDAENLTDYISKHHPMAYHCLLHPCFLHCIHC